MRLPAQDSADSAGRTSCSSPIPAPPPISSVSAPAGQPPPGRARSRGANPVGTTAAGQCPVPPRHTGWCCRMFSRVCTVYSYSTPAADGFQDALVAEAERGQHRGPLEDLVIALDQPAGEAAPGDA